LLSIQSLHRDIYNISGQIVESRDYFALSSTSYAAFSLGTASNDSSSGNYHATTYHYAPGALLDGIKAPTGTIERLIYDGLDRPVSGWVGTNDGSLDGSGNMQDFNPASPGNAVEVSAYLYDSYDPQTFVPGNGNVTRVSLFPTTNAADARVTENFF